MSLRHFLIVYDHRRGQLESSDEFDDSEKAVVAYSKMERAYAGREDMEIVLIGSDSFETVKRTHANYFEPPALSRYLRGL